MNNEMITLWLTQGEARLNMTIQKEVVEKMSEIKQRYPEGYWEKKEYELMKIADEELEQEAKEKGTTLPWKKTEKEEKPKRKFWQKK